MQKKLRKTKYFFGLFCFCLLSYISDAQIVVKGRILDKNSTPVFAANVYPVNHPTLGTTSDFQGLFLLKLSKETQSDTLIVSFIGYQAKRIPICDLDYNDSLIVVLEEKSNVLEEVVLRANKSLTKEFSIKEVDKISIYMLPVSYGDPLKAISFLPYSTNTSETANPELRGSAADYSRVVLNNIPLYSPVRNSQLNGMGNFSLLNTELVHNQVVYAGNPPLKYGNSIAGLVEVTSTESLEQEHETKLSLSLANAGVLHSSQLSRKSFVQVFGNYQFPDAYLQLNKKNSELIHDFKTIDAGLNFHFDLHKNFFLNTYSYFIDESFNASSYLYNYTGNMKANKKRNFNIVNFYYKAEKLVLSLNNGTNFSSADYEFGNIRSFQEEQQVYTSLDAKYFIHPNYSVQLGLSDDYFDDYFKNTLPYHYYAVYPSDSTYSFSHDIYNHNMEAYFYNKFTMNRLILGAGVRKNIVIGSQNDYWSYQGSLRYNFIQDHSVLISAGNYNAYTVPGFFVQSFEQINAQQLSLEYIFDTDKMNFNLCYYQKEEEAPVYYNEVGNSLNTITRIEGVETSFDVAFYDFHFFGAFTYLNSKFRTDEDDSWYHSRNDMDYLVKFAVNYYNLDLVNVSLNYTHHPGLYYTPVVSSEYNAEINRYRPVYGEFNSTQLNAYRTIDISLNKLFSVGKTKAVLFFTLSNVLNRFNQQKAIYNADYSAIESHWFLQKRLVYFGMQWTF